MNAGVQGDTEKLKDDLRTVAEDAEQLLRATSSQTSEKIQHARERAQVTLQRVRARLADFESEATRRAQEARNVTEDYVRENPWQSVFAAAGVGLVLGIVVSLGRRR
jgi:ElaB/YqjD/DUF883 family membrane-anchored ribosome-binding protein